MHRNQPPAPLTRRLSLVSDTVHGSFNNERAQKALPFLERVHREFANVDRGMCWAVDDRLQKHALSCRSEPLVVLAAILAVLGNKRVPHFGSLYRRSQLVRLLRYYTCAGTREEVCARMRELLRTMQATALAIEDFEAECAKKCARIYMEIIPMVRTDFGYAVDDSAVALCRPEGAGRAAPGRGKRRSADKVVLINVHHGAHDLGHMFLHTKKSDVSGIATEAEVFELARAHAAQHHTEGLFICEPAACGSASGRTPPVFEESPAAVDLLNFAARLLVLESGAECRSLPAVVMLADFTGRLNPAELRDRMSAYSLKGKVALAYLPCL